MALGIESLNIYTSAKEIEEKVYQLCKKFPKDEQFGKTSQLKRSASSIVDNIAESYGRYGYKEKIQFMVIARGSAEEAKSQLDRSKIICEDYSMIDDLIKGITTELKQINCYIKYLKSKSP